MVEGPYLFIALRDGAGIVELQLVGQELSLKCFLVMHGTWKQTNTRLVAISPLLSIRNSLKKHKLIKY